MNMESGREAKKEAKETRARQTGTPKGRVHTKYVLPSERNPFSVHFPILRRFIALTRNGVEPVSASNVEGEGVPVQAASMNVRFLRDIGLLTVGGRGLYIPTPDAIKFVSAMSVSDEKAKPILRGLLANAWFTELAQSLFTQRPLMSEDQFVGELALAAVTDKARKGGALRVIIDYLVYADILKRDEQGLSLATGAPKPAEAPLEAPSGPAQLPVDVTEGPADWHVIQTEDFYVKVRSDPDAFEDLGDHLELLKKKMWRLHQKKPETGDDEEEKQDPFDIDITRKE